MVAKISARTNGTGLGKRYCESTKNEEQLEGLQLVMRAVWQFYTHASRDAFIFGRQKEKACYRATSTGLEHGAIGSKSLTFTPTPTAPSDYHKKAGYLEEYKRHQERDLVMRAVVEFLNLLDGGFRGKMASWKCGQQVVLQPPSTKSDRRFTGSETVFAGSVAHGRGGNERAVQVCKLNGLTNRGLLPQMSATRLNNAWRAFGFRANFMYGPVL